MDIFEYVLFIGFVLLSLRLTERWRHDKRNTHKDTSVLLRHYSKDTSAGPLGRGKTAGLKHTSILFTGTNHHTIYVSIDLPFQTKLHLVGVSKTAGNSKINPMSEPGSIMEKVELEGDFPNLFDLYAEKGQQAQARYVFDPKAMEFVADFCRSHNWEILNDTLVFATESKTSTKDDETTMWDDIDDFVAQIRPAIEVSPTEAQIKLRTPLNEEWRTDLSCPICEAKMENHEVYLTCPDGHGALIKGGLLHSIRNKTLSIVANPPRTDTKTNEATRENLICPACKGTMQKVQYALTNITIDSCSDCPYRWLDAHEIELNSRYIEKE